MPPVGRPMAPEYQLVCQGRAGLLWLLEHPGSASRLLREPLRPCCPFRRELYLILEWVEESQWIQRYKKRIRRMNQVTDHFWGAMTANVAVNVCIELLQGDVAVLMFLACADRDEQPPLSNIWNRMIAAHTRLLYQRTGEQISRLVLFSDGRLQTTAVTTRLAVLPDMSGPPVHEVHRYERAA